MINDQMIKALKNGQSISEKINGLNGTVLIRKRSEDAPPKAYYRYSYEGKRTSIDIGWYKQTNASGGFTLREIRKRAMELALLQVEEPDLKAFLQKQEVEADDGFDMATDSPYGSLLQLFTKYIQDRKEAGVSQRQIAEYKRLLNSDLMCFPEIMLLPAREVSTTHIKTIVTPIVKRGSLNQADKVIKYLQAAFNFGKKYDNQIGVARPIVFLLGDNPATPVNFPTALKKQIGNAGTRALTNEELKHFYSTITKQDSGVSYVMGQLFRFVIASGGQRIYQVAREPWDSYKSTYVEMKDSKGRGSVERVHVIPITNRMRKILGEVKVVTGTHIHPFSYYPDQAFYMSAYSRAVKRWLESPYGILKGKPIEPFTPRDLRRTMAQLMQRIKIDQFDSNELQSHGVSGVVSKHYLNDPLNSLPRKSDTLDRLEIFLTSLLDG